MFPDHPRRERTSPCRGALRKLEARYRTLVEGIPAVTFMAALDEGVNELYVSPQIETLLGFSQKEWLEDPILWYARLHPDDRDRWHDEFARICSTGEPFHSIYRFVARDGRTVWVHGEAKVVRDDDGHPLFLQGVAFDITAIKQAEEELKALNQLLEQRVEERTGELMRSNAALERFGYVIAHDLRAPLRTIKSYTQKLPAAALTQLDAEAGDHLTRIVNAADRMRIQIDDLLAYSRVRSQGKEPAPTECTAAVAAACANVQADIEESGAAVTWDELPTVLADRTQLVQLFQNLLSNALKFRAERPPRIHLSTRRKGAWWLLSVVDNGIGIEAQYLERIFGLGERLHSIAKYPGNGIGLATCERIVQRHGGHIWAASPGPDQGSHVSLHVARRAAPITLGLPGVISSGWQLNDAEPEMLDRLHHFDELIQIDRLGDIAVHVEVVGGENVLLIVGTGHNHHRDASQVGVLLDLGEYLPAILARQVEVEQNEVRSMGRRMASFPPEEGHRLDSVVQDSHPVAHSSFSQSAERQVGVVGIVFYEQDFDWFTVCGILHGTGPRLRLDEINGHITGKWGHIGFLVLSVRSPRLRHSRWTGRAAAR